MSLKQLLFGYFIFISLCSAGCAIYDKLAAKFQPRRRVPENTLMYLGFLGGAAAMFAVMLLIRHKTRHKKFMVGLPVMIVLHIAVALVVVFLS